MGIAMLSEEVDNNHSQNRTIYLFWVKQQVVKIASLKLNTQFVSIPTIQKYLNS